MARITKLCARIIVAWVGLGCAGCNPFLSQFAGPGPQVNGRWTGRLVSIRMTDSQGHVYDAAALAIESGPGLPEQYRAVWEDTEAARVPVLVRTRNKPLLIISPKGLPIGLRVQVRGTMVMGFPNAPLPSGIEGGGIGVTRTTATGDPLSHGPLIMLAGGNTASITKL